MLELQGPVKAMSFWEFYQRLVAKAREADPDFPMFDQLDFIERVMFEADRLWEGLVPFIRPSPARYKEHWAQLSQRDRYWHWFCKTLWYAAYGNGGAIHPKQIWASAKYSSKLEGVRAPVPVRDEILGEPAITFTFTPQEEARMQRIHEAKLVS